MMYVSTLHNLKTKYLLIKIQSSIMSSNITRHGRDGLVCAVFNVREAYPGSEESLHHVLQEVTDGLHGVVGGQAAQHSGPCHQMKYFKGRKT